jgi:outer membrane protein, heavy metal efflux system
MLLVTAALLAVLTPAPLRLPDVLKEVSARAPTVRVAAAELAVGRAAVGVAGAWEDARLSVMSESIPLGRHEDAEPVMIAYRIGQPLNVFGRRRLAKRAARAEVDRGEAQLRRIRWDAQAQAVRIFYELWMIDQMASIIDEQLALLARMRESGLALVRAGMGRMGHHDVLRAESEIAAMEAERASLADERSAMTAMLNTLRGRPAEQAIGAVELPAHRALPAIEAVTGTARATPEAAAARAMQDRALAEQRLARRMYLPMVMVEAEYEHNLGGMPDGVGVGVSVTIPLWWWDRQRSEVEMARAMVRAAQREEEAMTSMADAELRMAWSRARSSERELTVLEEAAIPKLRETIASIEAAYAAGTGEFIALLDAVMELKNLELRRVRAAVRRGVARFELDRIAGRAVAL